MASVNNISSSNEAQFARQGGFTVNSTNPFYSGTLGITSATEASADSAGNITYTLSGTPDLSKIVNGCVARIQNFPSKENNGIKVITRAIDSADQIIVSNGGVIGVSETADKAVVSIKAPKTVGIYVNSDLTITTITKEDNKGGSASTSGYTAGVEKVDNITELVVSDGEATLIYGDGFIEPELY